MKGCDLCDNVASDLKQAGFEVIFVEIDPQNPNKKIERDILEANQDKFWLPAVAFGTTFRVVKSDTELPVIVNLMNNRK